MSDAGRLHEVRVQLEVPFHDVDRLGVVWHGHYFKYFELARTRLLRAIGLDAGAHLGLAACPTRQEALLLAHAGPADVGFIGLPLLRRQKRRRPAPLLGLGLVVGVGVGLQPCR